MNASAIRTMVVAALVGHTDAGDRVYSPRDWPTSSAIYPALLVQTPFDHKKALGRNTPAFTTVTTVRITGRVQNMMVKLMMMAPCVLKQPRKFARAG